MKRILLVMVLATVLIGCGISKLNESSSIRNTAGMIDFSLYNSGKNLIKEYHKDTSLVEIIQIIENNKVVAEKRVK